MRPLIIEPSRYTQADNATWTAISVGFIIGFILPVLGAIFLSNSIQLDRENGTMALFLTSSFTRRRYIFGKFLSNCCFMLIFWGITVAFTLIATLMKYRTVNLGQFLMVFLILLPGLCFVAALTLVIEVLPGLRGRLGTVLLSASLIFLYAAGTDYQTTPSRLVNIFNLSGSHYLIENIKQALTASGGGSLHVLRVIGSTGTHYTGQQSLVFPMIRLTTTDWVNISVLLSLSCLLVLLATLFLEHRPLVFKPAKRRDPIKVTKPWVTSFKQSRLYLAFRLLTGDVSRYWLWLLLITWLWSWTTTTHQMGHLALPLLFLLATPLFANLGATAVQTGVAQWLQTVPDGQRRQKWWASISGWLLALGLILPVVQQTTVMVYLALLIWALQLPLVAQLIRCLTKSQRPFQVILVVFFYLYLNGAPLLPFDQAHLFLPTLLYLSIGSLAALGLFGLKNNAFN